jgi:DNA-binding Lrp family transcriptional regulator
MPELDGVDLRILEILQEDARVANAELARRVGLTPTPTLERVRRLERLGVVRGYTAVVDPEALGLRLTVMASVTLAMHDAAAVDAFLRGIESLPEVMECHHLTGEADFLLKVRVADTRAYERLLRESLTQLPGVRQIRSSVVLSTPKNRTAVPLPDGARA